MTNAEKTLEAIDDALLNSRSAGYRKVSVGGWMGTILLSCIPVINFILWIIWAISAKRPSRRTFAGAMIILTVLSAAAIIALVFFFGGEIVEWARELDPHLFDALAD